MDYAQGTIKKFLDDLSLRTPAPGGGSVAALTLAFSAGLLSMACRYTIGKESCEAFSGRARLILKKSESIRRQALKLVDADIKAYLKKNKTQAIAVPAKVCRLSADILSFSEEVIRRGNERLKSDAQLAVSLSWAAMTAALGYVGVNLHFFKCGKKDEALYRELKNLCARSKKIMKVYGESSWLF